ncbi:hypothetical protein [Bacillus salitolerans]
MSRNIIRHSSSQRNEQKFDAEQYIIQHTIDQIIQQYYMGDSRDTIHLMKAIQQCIDRTPYFKCATSIVPLAIISNHLLQALPGEKEKKVCAVSPSPPVFIRELKAFMSVKLEIVEWTGSSFLLKKFLWKQEDYQLLIDILSIYSYYAFIERPTDVEFCCLYTCHVYRFSLINVKTAVENLCRKLKYEPNHEVIGTFYSISK